MTVHDLPVFNANSSFFQNIGLLKVAETATRLHGDKVVIRVSDTRDLYLLSGSDSVAYWRSNQPHFQTDLGAIASNAKITGMLLGQELSESRWAEIWSLTVSRLTSVTRLFDRWLDKALADASQALVAGLPTDGRAVDLRAICRDWSIRAVCPAIFGKSLDEDDIAQGITDVEAFYFVMSTRDAAETADHEILPEYIAARGFLDRIITVALENSQPQDETLIAHINAVIPDTVHLADRLNLLRPTVGRMITEKLNIGGLSLLWTLSHLARDAALVSDIAAEVQGKDIFAMSDEETPITFSSVCEGMRMYPELPFIYRIASQEVTLGPLRVPAKATVIFAPWLVQRDTKYWEAPTIFDGRRFLALDPGRDCYFPFGVGPHTRTRGRFILHQITVALRAICANASFDLAADCPRGNLFPLLRSALIPRGQVPVCFHRRANVSGALPSTPRGQRSDVQ